MADLDHIHTAIANLYPGATFGDYLWGRMAGEDGGPPGDPKMLRWDAGRFGPFDASAVLAECRRLASATPLPPDGSTLSDWRVALILWTRPDGSSRLDEVSARVAELIASGHPLSRVARERLEYANHVFRAELMQLRAAFGFTEAEVNESLWRADRVRQGDLSGVWPLP